MEGGQADEAADRVVLESVAQVPKCLIGQPQASLLPGGGEKSLTSQGTEEERERLCRLLDEERGALAGQRVTVIKSLSKGTWRADLQLVQVATEKGSVWAVHGHSHEGQKVLLPEEALFLMECGSLEVANSGIPMSVQQAYSTLLGNTDWAPYEVYAFLKRLGYAVWMTLIKVCFGQIRNKLKEKLKPYCPIPSGMLRKRMGTMNSLTGSNDCHYHSIRLPQETEEGEGCRQSGAQPVFPSCPLCHQLPSSQQRLMTRVLEVYQPKPRLSKSNLRPPDFRVIVTRPSAPFPSPQLLRLLSRVQPSAPLKLCPVDGTNIAFYSINSDKIQSLPDNQI